MNTTATYQLFSNTMEGDDLNVSSSAINQTSTTLTPSQLYKHYANNFKFYALGIVIPFGLIGNIFSMCIFLLSPILRRTTTGHYLVALAVADTTVLVAETLRWLTSSSLSEFYLPTSLGLNIYDTSNAACRITYFLRFGGGLWSVWLTIAIAVERLIAVALPLKISHISTLPRSRVIIVLIAIISFGLALFVFWHVEINRTPQCRIAKTMSLYKNYHTWNDAILKFGTLIIPGVVIAIITVIIIVLLYRARSKRMSQLATVSARGGERKHWSNSGLSTETQLTIMLVAVCIATTALRAPYTIVYYVYRLCDGNVNRICDTHTIVAKTVTEVFNIINYAINFILYCLSGSSFREQIRKTICRGKKTGNKYNTQQISLETSPTPQLGSSIRLLKTTTPRESPSAQTNDI